MSNQEQQFIPVSNGILSPDSIAAFLVDPSNYPDQICATDDCENQTSSINLHSEDAVRDYCEKCYLEDQEHSIHFTIPDDEDLPRLVFEKMIAQLSRITTREPWDGISYQEQLAKCKDPTDDYGNVWPNKTWTIADYEQLFEDIDRGYIQKEPYEGNYFVINEDYEE